MFISTIGAGDSISAMPYLSKRFLKRILPLKTQAEDYLADSGLNYITIRTGRTGERTSHWKWLVVR